MSWKHIWAAAALTIAVGANPASAQMTEGVAAVVNDEVISTFDVRQRANLILLSAGLQPTAELQERARAQALRDLVDEHLQLQEAASFDLRIADDEIDRRIDQIAEANETSRADFLQGMAQAGVGPATLRQQIAADTAWSRLMSGLYRSRVRISQEEVRRTQERIAANATRPQYLVSEIFLPASTDSEFAEMQAGAQRLLEQMQRGAPFPLVARQFSAAATAAAGGDLGWLSESELPPQIQTVAAQLQPGQVSVPFRTDDGIYIIALRDRREGIPAGSATIVALRQITAPESQQNELERLQRRISTCEGLESSVSGVTDAQVVDLGEPIESDLSPAVRERINGVAAGSASPVAVQNGQASMMVVCGRTVGGSGVPSADEIENRLYEQEMARLAERYLRNLRREATIITR